MDIDNKRYITWVSIAFTFIAVVTLISISTLESVKEQTKYNIQESLNTVLQTTLEAHHLWINNRERGVQEIAEDRLVLNHTKKLLAREDHKTINHTLIELRNFIRPKLRKNNDKGFFVISPDRISIASMRNSNLGTVNLIQNTRREYLDSAFNGVTTFVPTVQSDVPLSSTSNKLNKKEPTSFILSPIIDSNNAIIAVLAIRIDPYAQFTRISQLGRLGDTGETYAFDKNGLLITESRFDHHLRKAGLIPVGDTGILSIRITDPGGNLLKGYKPQTRVDELPLTVMAQSAITGNSGSNVDGYRDYRGVNVFGAWRWDKTLEFGITTEIDVDEALQPYYQTRNTIILAVTLIAILSFLFVFVTVWLQKKSREKLHNAYNELEIRIEERTKELKSATDELSKANQDLEYLAITDGLTGLYNRRKFDEKLEMNIGISSRGNQAISVIMLDIDYFKQYNDNYGHQAGDECLKKVARALIATKITNRPGDIIARYGGEEFVVMLFDSNEQHTFSAARRIQDEVQCIQVPHEHKPSSDNNILTVSMGIYIEDNAKTTNAKSILKKADEALYKAKAKGRDCICTYAQITGVA